MKKLIAAALSVIAMTACLLGLAGCTASPDVKDIQGVWKIEDTNPAVTVVFTDSEWRLASNIEPYKYTLDTKASTFSNDVEEGTATYEFSEDRQTLSLTQTDENGKTETRTFDKVSDDTSAEPSVGNTTEPSED